MRLLPSNRRGGNTALPLHLVACLSINIRLQLNMRWGQRGLISHLNKCKA